MDLAPVQREHTAPQSEDAARRRLRTGAARVAQEMRDTGQGVGQGFRAEAMAFGVGSRNLGRMADGMNPIPVTRPTARWCGTCKRAGAEPWQPLDHECGR